MNTAEYLTYETSCAVQDARDQLDAACKVLEDASRIIQEHREKLDEVKKLNKKADVMNSAIQHLTGYMAWNIRFDRIANAQAELLRLHR